MAEEGGGRDPCVKATRPSTVPHPQEPLCSLALAPHTFPQRRPESGLRQLTMSRAGVTCLSPRWRTPQPGAVQGPRNSLQGCMQRERTEQKGGTFRVEAACSQMEEEAPSPALAQPCPTQPSHNSVSATTCCLAEWPFLEVAWPVPFS